MADIIIVKSGSYFMDWIEEQLAETDHQVRVCTCPFDALMTIIKKDRPALVIVDATYLPFDLPEVPAHTKLLAVFRVQNSYFEVVMKRHGVYCIQIIQSAEILPIIRYILR